MLFVEHMTLFVAVVRNKSFSKTALQFDIAQSSLSRKISELENHLGLKLIHRTTRKLELTEAGQFYFERAVAIVDETERTHQAMSGLKLEPEGVLKLSVNNEIGDWLTEILPTFYQKYPKIRLHIDVSAHKTDLLTGGVDMVVRAGEPTEGHYIIHPLTQTAMAMYASQSYLDAHGTPATPDELHAHRCLSYLGLPTWTLIHGDQTAVIHTTPICQSNDFGLLAELARQGLGIVLLPTIAKQKTGLVPVLVDWQESMIPIVMLTATRLLPIKVRCMIEFLQAHAHHFENHQI
ncbi:LysR family transcriptional regulator [Moraxella nasibovis]|uniref:LysR family transcriptional regulator n=1 Tax=Moraxella nasibovis TaxID=2904120 RepID=UPI0024106585|nr:LysR family transcriptional regulator [Moraxella nasibovis]WFF38684.1 LysR family transcriptional regulator [Moraxella nasibovis]